MTLLNKAKLRGLRKQFFDFGLADLMFVEELFDYVFQPNKPLNFHSITSRCCRFATPLIVARSNMALPLAKLDHQSGRCEQPVYVSNDNENPSDGR